MTLTRDDHPATVSGCVPLEEWGTCSCSIIDRDTPDERWQIDSACPCHTNSWSGLRAKIKHTDTCQCFQVRNRR